MLLVHFLVEYSSSFLVLALNLNTSQSCFLSLWRGRVDLFVEFFFFSLGLDLVAGVLYFFFIVFLKILI